MVVEDLGAGEENGERFAETARHRGRGRLVRIRVLPGGKSLTPRGQPVADRLDEVFTHDRFREVGIGAEMARLLEVAILSESAEKKKGSPVEGPVPSQGRKDAATVEDGHHLIAEDEVGMLVPGRFKPLAAIGRGEDAIAFQFEEQGEIRPQGGLILDDEEGFEGGVGGHRGERSGASLHGNARLGNGTKVGGRTGEGRFPRTFRPDSEGGRPAAKGTNPAVSERLPALTPRHASL